MIGLPAERVPGFFRRRDAPDGDEHRRRHGNSMPLFPFSRMRKRTRIRIVKTGSFKGAVNLYANRRGAHQPTAPGRKALAKGVENPPPSPGGCDGRALPSLFPATFSFPRHFRRRGRGEDNAFFKGVVIGRPLSGGEPRRRFSTFSPSTAEGTVQLSLYALSRLIPPIRRFRRESPERLP